MSRILFSHHSIDLVAVIALILSGCSIESKGHKRLDSNHCTVGLSSDKGVFCANVTWKIGPSIDDSNSAVVEFFNPEDGSPLAVESINVIPWMKIHGHGSGSALPAVDADLNQPGRFVVSEIFFVMSGPWELNLTARFGSSEDRIEYPVSVPKQ